MAPFGSAQDVPQVQILSRVEAEEAVLGSVLLNTDVLDEPELVALRPSDFHSIRYGWAWEAIQDLRQNRVPVDFLTLANELERRGHLAEFGGQAALSRFLTAVPTSLHAAAYAREILDVSDRRGLLAEAHALAQAAYNLEISPDEARAECMSRLVTGQRVMTGAVQVKAFFSELYDQVERMAKNPRETFGIPSGFIDFDKITGGFQRGEAFILSGEPGIGKTKLMTQAAFQAAGARFWPSPSPMERHPGVIYELEMNGRDVCRRLLSAHTNIAARSLRSGRVKDDEWPSIVQATVTLSDVPVYMSDATNWTTTTIRADLARLVQTAGIEWFMVDYMDLLLDCPGRPDLERVAFISRELKRLCKDFNLAGLFVQVQNKEGMKAGAPKSHHLMGTIKQAYDADNIVFLTEHVPGDGEMKNPNLVTLVWAKARNADGQRKMNLVNTGDVPAFRDEALARTVSLNPAKNGNGRQSVNGNRKNGYGAAEQEAPEPWHSR